MQLPLTPIPNTNPPRFRWKQLLHTPTGPRIVEHEGTVPLTLETALIGLVTVARQQDSFIKDLQRDNEELAAQLMAAQERIAALTGTGEQAAKTVRKGRG